MSFANHVQSHCQPCNLHFKRGWTRLVYIGKCVYVTGESMCPCHRISLTLISVSFRLDCEGSESWVVSVHSSYLLGSFFYGRLHWMLRMKPSTHQQGVFESSMRCACCPFFETWGIRWGPSGNGSAIYTADGLTSVLLAGKGIVFIDNGDPQQTSH